MPLIQDYNKLFEHTDDIKKVIFNGNVVWPTVKPTGPDYTEPFYVENITNEVETLSIVKDWFYAPTLTIEYSTDKSTWQTFGTTSETALTRTLVPGEKLYLKCSANTWNENNIRGIIKVGGNLMSLLYGDQFADKTHFPSGSVHNFSYLFYNNTDLVDASELLLPATTLSDYCYQSMFQGCTSLVTAPVLPAMTLANSCYSSMFQYCTSLVTAPALPAMTLVNGCYAIMFFGCTSLTSVTCLATSGINENAPTSIWLYNVSSNGTFTKAAGVTWPTGTSGIPSGWTVVEV